MTGVGRTGERRQRLARTALGSSFLTWSALAARHHRGPPALRAVTAILGARHLLQGLLTAGQPARAVLALGAEADAVHCASMIAVGSLSRRWRAAAFADAMLAGSLAAGGAVSARRLPPGQAPGSSDQSPGAGSRRDRYAQALARHLAPAWLVGDVSAPRRA